jgi:phage-related protein (TIGR01555 family)
MALKDRIKTAARVALDAATGAEPSPGVRVDAASEPLEPPEQPWREAQSRLDSLISTATGMGVAAQDKGATVTVDTARTALTDRQIDTLTTYNGYVVDYFDKLEDVATGFGWSLQIDRNKSEALREDEKRLNVHDSVGEAFRSGQEHGGAILLPVVDDGSTRPEDLLTPLDPSAVTHVHALHVFHWDEISVVDYETSMLDPAFRAPKIWELAPKNAGWVSPGSEDGPYRDAGHSIKIHHSRVLYFRGQRTEPFKRALNGGRDASVVQHLWDALKSLGGVDAGAATMAQEMNFDVIQIAGLSRMEASSAWNAILTRFKIMALGRSMWNALLIGEDDKHERRNVNATGYKELKEGSKSTWASHTGMPETLAFGMTPSGMSTDGESSRRNWDRKGAVLQRKVVRPPLERLYFDFLIPAHGGGEKQALEDARLIFEPIGTLTRKQQSDLDRHDAETHTMYLERGVLYPDEVREALYNKDGKRAIGPIEPVRGGSDGGLSPSTLAFLQTVAGASKDGALKAGEIALALLKDGKAPDMPTEIEPPAEPPPMIPGELPGVPGEEDAEGAEDGPDTAGVPGVDGRTGAKPEQQAQKNPTGITKGQEV